MKKKATILVVLLVLTCLISTASAGQAGNNLVGYVRQSNGAPARGVIMTIGSYSTGTGDNGYYRFSSLQPREYVVTISPPGKLSRSYKVSVTGNPTQKNFTIDW